MEVCILSLLAKLIDISKPDSIFFPARWKEVMSAERIEECLKLLSTVAI